jgi:hypothetical protein
MNDIRVTQSVHSAQLTHLAGAIAMVIGILSAICITSMLLVTLLQVLLIFKALTFEQQLPWIALAIILGVGSWLIMTGLVAQSTSRLPNSLLLSALAVPYFGYPAWAFWLGLRLLNW